jgi:hypothetical protein
MAKTQTLKQIFDDLEKQKLVPDRIFMSKEEFDFIVNWPGVRRTRVRRTKDEDNKTIT